MERKLYFYQIINNKIKVEEVLDYKVPDFVLDMVGYNATMFSNKKDNKTLQYFKANVIAKCEERLSMMNFEVKMLNEFIKTAKGE